MFYGLENRPQKMKRLPLIIILIIAIGCSRTNRLNDSLNEAEHLISANELFASNNLLDSIGAYIDEMPDSMKARYYYLHALSNKKSRLPLSEDITLRHSVRYYRSTGDSVNRQQCEILYGKALIDAHIEEGRIGSMYLDSIINASLIKNDTATAIEILTNFYSTYQESNSFLADEIIYLLHRLHNLNAVLDSRMSFDFNYNQLFGLYYLGSENKQRRDSSIIFFENALRTCSTPADSSALYSFVLRNYIAALTEARQSHKAIELCRQLIADSAQHSKIAYLDLAMAHIQAGNADSAGQYLDSLERNIPWYTLQRDNLGYIYSAMRLLQEYNTTGHYSMHEFNKLNDYNSGSLKFALDRLKQSQRTQRVNANRELKLRIDRQKRNNWLMLFGIALITVTGGIVFYIKRHSRIIAEKEDQIESLLSTVRKLETDSTDNNAIKRTMLQQLGILKLVASNPTTANQELLQAIISVANREVDTDSLLDWDDIYRTMDYVYDRFYSKLRDMYGDILNEQEIRLCCLLKSGFSTKEIMLLTQQSLQTVYQRKSSIRKKTGMPEKTDIPEFIEDRCRNRE